MSSFQKALEKKINNSLYNDYSKANYDEIRFGIFPTSRVGIFKSKCINFTSSILSSDKDRFRKTNDYLCNLTHKEELNFLWEKLNEKDKELLIEIIAFRLMGFGKVKLSRNNKEYSAAIKRANSLADKHDVFDPGFMHFKLNRMNLKPVGKNIQLYFSPLGVAIDYIIEQYSYKQNNEPIIQAELGDTVLDLGGCWGDTALYFAEKVGTHGRVFSFEFIPNNIEIFNKNVNLNPNLKSIINLVPYPVTDKSGDNLFFRDNGPASQVKMEPFKDQTGSVESIAIDDFVEKSNINKIDFIKMDIEGSELLALKGAEKTIRKHKPKLAIAIYHSMGDMVGIPKWIDSLDVGYKLYLAHCTIHAEETVIFARIED